MGGRRLEEAGDAETRRLERRHAAARRRVLSQSRGYRPAGHRRRRHRSHERDRLRGGFRQHAPHLRLLPTVSLTRWALVPLLVRPSAPAQQPATASVRGVVRDSATGAPIVDAEVTARDSGGWVAHTNGKGAYELRTVDTGTVVIRVRRLGYQSTRRTVTLARGDTLRLDIYLASTTVELPPVVVNAGKRSQLLDQAVTSVALVTPTDIARRGVTKIDEVIDKAPGVQFLGGQINIRGSSGFQVGIGSRVLMLVDGVPANQGDRGGIDWDLLPL